MGILSYWPRLLPPIAARDGQGPGGGRVILSPMRTNLRSLLVLLLVWVTGASAHACAICAPDNTQTNLVQRLLAADAAILAGFAGAEADRTIDPIILEVIKGPLPAGAAVRQPVRVVSADRADAAQSVQLLLFSGGTWRSAGTLGLERADWARRLLTMSGTDWPKRLAAFAPDLESAEPLVAQTAYEEISIAPYAAMRGIATQLNARYAMVFYLMRSPLPQATAGLEALHAQGVL
jgi:hypothetical protein